MYEPFSEILKALSVSKALIPTPWLEEDLGRSKKLCGQGDPSAEGSTIEGQSYEGDYIEYISNGLRELREGLIRILIYFTLFYFYLFTFKW